MKLYFKKCWMSLSSYEEFLTSAISQHWTFLVLSIFFRSCFLLQSSQNCIHHNEVAKPVHFSFVCMQHSFNWILCRRLQSLVRHFIWAILHFSSSESIELCICNSAKNAWGYLWMPFNALNGKIASVLIF